MSKKDKEWLDAVAEVNVLWDRYFAGRDRAADMYADLWNRAVSERERAAAIVLAEWKPDHDAPIH